MIGRVYKIITNCSDEKIYIGSTQQECERRWQEHTCHYKLWKNGKTNYTSSFDLFEKYGIDNCRIVLIKQYEVVDEKHLRVYEQLYINKFKPINKVNSFFIRFLSDKNRYKKLLKMRPNYHQERYQQALVRNPNHNKDEYQRKLERNPNHNQDDYQRKLERNPNYHQERYQQALVRNPNHNKDVYQNRREQQLKTKSEKITCECGAIISRGNISKHIITKKHLDNLNSKPKIDRKSEKITCECGLEIRRDSLWRHKQRSKHQKLMEQQQQL